MRTRFTFSTNVEQTIKQSRRNNKMYLFNKSGTANKKTYKQTNKQASKTQTNNKMYLFNKSGTAWAGKSGGTKMEFGGGAWKFKFWNLKGAWKLNFEVHGGVKFSWTDFPPGGIQLNLIFTQVARTELNQGGRSLFSPRWQVAFNWTDIHQGGIQLNYSPANCQGVPKENKGAVGEPEKIKWLFCQFFGGWIFCWPICQITFCSWPISAIKFSLSQHFRPFESTKGALAFLAFWDILVSNVVLDESKSVFCIISICPWCHL